jgi:succinate-semialdehyde dehydrogenase/glutarate-semialdehyde dehydrogenase
MAVGVRVGHDVVERVPTGLYISGAWSDIVSDSAAPFGGVEASGLGRAGGREGIEEYLSTRYFAIATG